MMGTNQVRAASRLHFGLLAPSEGHERRFGGIGVMIESPSVALSLAPADHFAVEGVGQDRVQEFASIWTAANEQSELPPCRITVRALPPMHTGLGVGSQLGLCVARLLDEFVGRSPAAPDELARSVGRGARSAVGTYGFFYGGLIAERGKLAHELLAPLHARVELPSSWRWLLIRPREHAGLYGTKEQRAFSDMLDPARDRAQELLAEMEGRLLPAARQRDFTEFSASLYRFGYKSGLCFAAVQGGAYNGERLQRIVDQIRDLGIEGVGQSSWGPTIFALCPDEGSAQSVANQLRQSVSDSDVAVTATCNHGARVHSIP
jgi:beta-ribofuranosylaminobenzene 5'-phosphate synthase